MKTKWKYRKLELKVTTNNLKIKAMKTKIKTLILVCTLGTIGFTNIHAISDSKKEVVNDKPEIFNIESVLTDEALLYSAQAFSDVDIENEIEYNAMWESLAEEISLLEENVGYSAQAFSSIDIQKEIDDNAILQILLEENSLMNEVKYSAKAFSDLDFENELKNRE
jgi:hypothetical protein